MTKKAVIYPIKWSYQCPYCGYCGTTKNWTTAKCPSCKRQLELIQKEPTDK